ncbi:hypothetical protein GR183_02240 [Stappia sp. GBMRC 2046]|uniref:Uncharacterized protein n=1 Tax=Stappia sediminis TaxID=2692190 RepID=A0A7X3LRF7_9HYPH|nr:hypothetical protein [Stappia sediminis]MXN63711.1 hypothetical protein [Stappia sediminis]
MDFSAARPPLFQLAAAVAREPAAPSAPVSATALPVSQAVPASQRAEKPSNNAKPKRPDGRARKDEDGEPGEGGSDDDRRSPAHAYATFALRSDDPRPESWGETLLHLRRALATSSNVDLSGLGLNKIV